MVSRHAFRGAGTKWIRLDTGDVADLGALPEATPTKMRAGINDLVVVRIGDTVHALHAVCAHAGGPLDEGTIVDGCVECPWHALAIPAEPTGSSGRGPSVYDQPSYEVRAAEGGGYEVRRQRRHVARPRSRHVSTLVLPDPSLVVLIGAAGSGQVHARGPALPARRDPSPPMPCAPPSPGTRPTSAPRRSPSGILHRTLGRRLAAGRDDRRRCHEHEGRAPPTAPRARSRDRRPGRRARPGPAARRSSAPRTPRERPASSTPPSSTGTSRRSAGRSTVGQLDDRRLRPRRPAALPRRSRRLPHRTPKAGPPPRAGPGIGQAP